MVGVLYSNNYGLTFVGFCKCVASSERETVVENTQSADAMINNIPLYSGII